MILYFSATGNTEFIAKELAARLGDESLNLIGRLRNKDHSEIHSDRPWVICSPVYVCEMPRFFAEFLRELDMKGSRDVFFVFTSGGYCGMAGSLAKGIARRKGLTFRGYTELKMPRNYPVSRRYDMLSDDEARGRIAKAYGRLDSIADAIRDGGKLKHRYVFLFEKAVTLPFNPVWCKIKFKADDFHVNDDCIGCGLCERVCPLVNISLNDKRPVWSDNCTHCMACLSSCPKGAIDYGTAVAEQGRYNIRDHREFIEGLKGTEEPSK